MKNISKYFLFAAVFLYFLETSTYIGAQVVIAQPVAAARPLIAQSAFLKYLTRLEADYIVACQYNSLGNPAHGAINNVYGVPTWVVPRENALAILGLIEASRILKDPQYKAKAQLAADYLVSVQDPLDGAWYDQYSFTTPVVLSKSPTQTAEVMMALYRLGYDPTRYMAMKMGAQYLLASQDVMNKGGFNDGLIGGGKNAAGQWHKWRWASDNSWGYQALRAAEAWAMAAGDFTFAALVSVQSQNVINGIGNHLWVTNASHLEYGAWYRAIDEWHNVQTLGHLDWINYAPAMIDLSLGAGGGSQVGNWINVNLQKPNGAVVWDNASFNNRQSPGYSFQASLTWQDFNQNSFSKQATNWALGSGLWQKTPDALGIKGGWIDWIENGQTAQQWERFIDTSFYAISAFKGGYDFSMAAKHSFGQFDEITTPALGDLDQDGIDDIVVYHATMGEISAFSGGGKSVKGWPVSQFGTESIVGSGLGSRMLPAISDIDRDGKNEVIAAVWTASNKIFVVVFSHNGQAKWWRDVTPAANVKFATVAVDDLNNDGKDEIVSGGPELNVFDYQGNLLAHTTNVPSEQNTFVALGDVDRDGFKDIVIGSSPYVYAVDRFGNILPGWPTQTANPVRSPVLGDINNDGYLEVVASDVSNTVYVWDNLGQIMSGWPIGLPNAGLGAAACALANYDTDPESEIIASAQGNGWFGATPQIHVINGDGSGIVQYNVGGPYYNDPGPIVIEIDSSLGQQDIIVGTNSLSDLRVFPSHSPEWPKMLSSNAGTSPAAADVNGDGLIEVIMPVQNGDVFVLLTSGQNIAANLEWPMYRGNAKRTGRYPVR